MAKITQRKNPDVFQDDPNCPVRDVLTGLTRKWPMLVLFALMDGPARFTQLKTRIENISQRMLTVTLRHLERDGFIIREVYPEVPPKVEYTLTPMGKELVKPLSAMAIWVEERHDNVREARDSYDELYPPKKA